MKDEVKEILLWIFVGIISIVIIYSLYANRNDLTKVLPYYLFIIGISVFGYSLYFFGRTLQGGDYAFIKDSPLTLSFYAMLIIIILIFMSALLWLIPSEMIGKEILKFMGLDSVETSYMDTVFILLITLLLSSNVLFSSDQLFNFIGLPRVASSYLIIIFSLVVLTLFALSIFGFINLSLLNKKFFLILIPILLLIILNVALYPIKIPYIVDNVEVIGFIISIFCFLIYLSSMYFKDFDSITTFGSGLFLAVVLMLFPIMDKFVVNIFNFDNKNAFALFGVIALLAIIILGGKLVNFKNFPSSINITESLRMDNLFSNNVFFYTILLIILLVIGIRYIGIEKNERTAIDEFEILKSMGLFLIPLVLIMLLGTNIFKSNTGGVSTIFYSMLTLFFIFLYFFLLSILSDDQKDLLNYLSGTLFLIGIVLFLCLIVLMTGNFMMAQEGVFGIISYLIFYIPCLLLDLINYLKKEAGLVTPTVGIVFVLEIITILAYLYLPALFNKATSLTGIDLVKEPVILKEEATLPGGEMFIIPKDGKLTGMRSVEKPRYNYAISMWVYINTNANNANAYANEMNIFNYDNKPSVSYKLNISGCSKKSTKVNNDGQIVYEYDTNDGCNPEDVNEDNVEGRSSNFIFKLSNNRNSDDEFKTIKVDLPQQKWQFIVFNYHNNAVDIFINGNLYSSYKFDDIDRPTYNMINDNVIIGQEKGLEGVICNTKYHTKPLTKFEIVNTYNLLMNYNPPINNL